jgi:RNA polymerase sigma-70 factor (ECF subfamily)
VGHDPQDEAERLFRQYGRGAASYVLARVGDAELAEEITARVFLTVVRRLSQRRGSAAAWLWAIVRSELARHFRRRPTVAPPADLPGPDAAPLEEAIRRETQAKLQAALARLAPQQQQLIYMKFFLNMPHQEIAEAAGMTPSNVGVTVFRTLRELRRLMAGDERLSER